MDIRFNQIEKMSLRALVKSNLDATELNQAKLLFNSTSFISGIQNPELSTVIGKNALHILIYGDDNFSIIGYALVEIKKKVLATIPFGPLCADKHLFPLLANACVKALQDYGIKIIRYQPPFLNPATWQATVAPLQGKFISFSLPSELNMSTLILDISPSEEKLINSFSAKHRWSIRKAEKDDKLIIEQVVEPKDIDGFAEGFCKMYAARKLPFDLEVEKERIKNLYEFNIKKGNGLILRMKSGSQLLGGIILIRHKNTMIYFLGFSDPDHKNIPIHHSLFLKAFEIAKLSGCTYFDFGGYARPENADEQLLKINKFKDGFNGKRIDHPDTILFAKNLFYKFLYIYFVKFFKAK